MLGSSVVVEVVPLFDCSAFKLKRVVGLLEYGFGFEVTGGSVLEFSDPGAIVLSEDRISVTSSVWIVSCEIKETIVSYFASFVNIS